MSDTIATPVRETWFDLVDDLSIGQELPIPFKKLNSLANLVSLKFHKDTLKRFKVTYKDCPKGQAKVTRLEDADDTIDN